MVLVADLPPSGRDQLRHQDSAFNRHASCNKDSQKTNAAGRGLEPETHQEIQAGVQPSDVGNSSIRTTDSNQHPNVGGVRLDTTSCDPVHTVTHDSPSSSSITHKRALNQRYAVDVSAASHAECGAAAAHSAMLDAEWQITRDTPVKERVKREIRWRLSFLAGLTGLSVMDHEERVIVGTLLMVALLILCHELYKRMALLLAGQ